MPEEEPVVKKRAPRKRTVKKADADIPAKKTTRKVVKRRRVVKKEEAEEQEVERTPRKTLKRRKAPTPIQDIEAREKSNKIIMYSASGLFVVSLGVSLMIGFSDKGAIDVEQVIIESVQSNDDLGGDTLREVTDTSLTPAQNAANPNLASRALRPAGAGEQRPEPEPEPETATSTASSTDETATSSDEVSEEEEEVVEETSEDGAVEEEEVVEPESPAEPETVDLNTGT